MRTPSATRVAGVLYVALVVARLVGLTVARSARS